MIESRNQSIPFTAVPTLNAAQFTDKSLQSGQGLTYAVSTSMIGQGR